MAQETHVVLSDDLTGGPATRTVRFWYDGVSYQIDLNDENAERFAQVMEPYTTAARRAPVTAAPVPRARTSAYRGVGRDRAALIRAWGPEHGYQVSGFGRIPTQLIEAYEAAHAGA